MPGIWMKTAVSGLECTMLASHDQAEKLISIALRADERDAAGGRAMVSLAH